MSTDIVIQKKKHIGAGHSTSGSIKMRNDTNVAEADKADRVMRQRNAPAFVESQVHLIETRSPFGDTYVGDGFDTVSLLIQVRSSFKRGRLCFSITPSSARQIAYALLTHAERVDSRRPNNLKSGAA